MRDFTIHLTHKPGELSRVANALAKKGVNIRSLAGMAVGSQGLLRFIPDDTEGARSALEENKIRFDEKEVVTVMLENQAGEIALVADKLSNGGLNLDAIYVLGLSGDLVELALAVDDVKKAKKLLE
jgi:hypothetical protein